MGDTPKNMMNQAIPVASADAFSDLSEVAIRDDRGGDSTGFFKDLDAIRVDGINTGTSVTEMISTIPVRKPLKDEFFRISSDPRMTLTTTIYVDKQERGDCYFVPPDYRPLLLDQAVPMILRVGITRQHVLFVWPIGISTDGRPMGWYDTARHAATEAETVWTRIAADKPLGGYRIYRAEGNIPDPVWPNLSMNIILSTAFKGRIIDSVDHPIIRRLKGL